MRRVTFSGRLQGVNFEHKYKTYFCGIIISVVQCNKLNRAMK